MLNLTKELTVFVISCGNNPNYPDCLNALNKQSCTFKQEIIKNVAPLSAAFQRMLDLCTTPYYVQVDEDMILKPESIELMYNNIKISRPKLSMLCFKLYDPHWKRTVDGIKIYKHAIFKQFPYQNIIACEMNQLARLKSKGFEYYISSIVVAEHSPKWTNNLIYHRYHSLMQREIQQGVGLKDLPKQLLDIYNQTPSELNLFAFLGAITSIVSKEKQMTEKNFTNYNTTEFTNLSKFIGEPAQQIKLVDNKKYKVVQLAEIPCANSGFELSKLLNKYSTKYESRYILHSEYGKGSEHIPFRKFPSDLFWQTNKDQCIEVIKQADIIHVHHDFDISLIQDYIANKPIIYTLYAICYLDTAYNKMSYYKKIKTYAKFITTADQPLQKKIFADITTTKLPLINMLFDDYKEKNNTIPTVVFAPTNRYRVGASKKMYYEVIDTVNKLKNQGLLFDFILNEGLAYEEDLIRKSKADIIIDDVDPDYEKWHNTSIQGVCFGAVPLTNFHDNDYPFLKTNIHTLKQTLAKLILDKSYLIAEKARIYEWLKSKYTPSNLLIPYEELYQKCI